MVSISPRPTYNISSPSDDWRVAAELPVSPLKNFAWQAEEGFLSSFGAGTVARDLLTPSGNTAPAPGIGVPIFDQLLGAGATLRRAGDALFAKPEPSMTADQWKASPHFRDAIPYDPGMTESRAAALAASFDIKQARAYFAEKSPVTTFVGQFVGQAFDPINFLPVFGPGARAAAAAKFGIFGHIGINASEAAINTAAFAALSAPERRRLGDDVSWQMQINDVAMSALIGAAITPVLHGLTKGVELAEGFRQRTASRIQSGVETVPNAAAGRSVLNNAVTSYALDGEVKLTPGDAQVLTRLNEKVTAQREAAVSLKRETADITGEKPGKVVITPSGSRVEVKPEVVELADLIKAEGALQVRDRSRAASASQIEDIAINLDPARLMPSIEADRGAPIVGDDNIVDSGNGRVAAIKRAYENYPDQAAGYRAAIEEAGYSTEGFANPVLVSRRLTKLSPEARAQFNAEANTSATARMSATEIAAMDRGALDDGTLRELADGPVTSAENRAFVRRFLGNLPGNERSALVTADGALSMDGQRRVENALVATAYGDVDAGVVARFAEATDDNSRSIIGAMADVAGRWALMRRAIKAGEISAEFDMTPELTTALRKLSGWREAAAKEGRPVSIVIKEGMGQLDMLDGELPLETKTLLRMFYKTDEFKQSAGRDAIAMRLGKIIDATNDLGRPQLFGDALAASKLGVIENAIDDLEADLFAADRARTGTDAFSPGRGQYAPGADRGNGAQGAQVGKGSIADRMTERFAAAGRPADEAKAAGALVDAFYRTQAERLGMSLPDFEARFGLPEVRQGTGAATLPEGMLGQSARAAQTVVDGLQRDAKAITDFLEGKSLTPKRDGSINVPSAVTGHVLSVTKDDDVLGSVVGALPVDVVNLFARKQLSPEIALRDKAMLKDVLTVDRAAAVALGVDPTDSIRSLMRVVASAATERASGLARRALIDGAANDAGFGDSVSGAHVRNVTETPEFSKWFADSKVVDAEGKPLVVYHGSGMKFDAFDPMARPATDGGMMLRAEGVRPFFFTNSKAIATDFAGNDPNYVMPLYLRIERPLEIDAGRKGWDSFHDQIVAAAKGGVHDGVILRNLSDVMFGDDLDTTISDVYVAFDPTQIKSVNNRGTFDPNDPRILFQPAYHGTPHIFDKFDSSKIGTGEGAQAFGHGLYFAGRKEVAKYYRDALAGDDPNMVLQFPDGRKEVLKPGYRGAEPPEHFAARSIRDSEFVDGREGAIDRAIDGMREEAEKAEAELAQRQADGAPQASIQFAAGLAKLNRDAMAVAERWKAEGLETIGDEKPGRLLTVDIPGDDELLAWDAPLSQQPKAVLDKILSIPGVKEAFNKIDAEDRALLKELGHEVAPSVNLRAGGLPAMSGEGFYQWLSKHIGMDEAGRRMALNGQIAGREVGAVAASNALREAGIPGHRFLDQGSRPSSEAQALISAQGSREKALALAQKRADEASIPRQREDWQKLVKELEHPETHNYVIYDDSRINVTGFEQGARGAIEFGDDGRSIISLFETADSSTALHEVGHHFLHLLKSMAEREDAPLPMRADWDVVKNWWAANADAVAADSPSAVTGDDVRMVLTTGTTGDRVKDLAINVGLQEQWARGFEAYLREGTAPTSRLAGVFEQFKQWLTQVYRSIKDLNVNLSDDIKGVFDRLLSTTDQSMQTQGNRGENVAQPALDFSSPPPEPPIEGLEEAAARVGHQDSPKAMREMFGLKDDGSFDEQADIDQYREMGILDEQDEAMLKLADDAVKAADAYEETLRVAASCIAGGV